MTRSRVTITRTGNPGRTVIVGWMLSERPTTCLPVWLIESDEPLRPACS